MHSLNTKGYYVSEESEINFDKLEKITNGAVMDISE